VPPADPRALADGIRKLWRDPALRARLAAGGRNRVTAAFSWRRAAEQTLAVYEELLPATRRSFAWNAPSVGSTMARDADGSA
jgi:hypothetical protein